MNASVISTYLTLVIILLMIAYAGVEGTLRVFTYLDVTIRLQFIKLQMKWMGWKLKRQLIKDTTDFKNFLKEYKDD